MQYGPAGPSPPVSAASSPIDSGPYPHHLHDDRVDPLSLDASRSIYPPPLPTSPVSPSSPISRTAYPQQMPPTSWPVPAPMPVPPPIPNPGHNVWPSLFVPPPNATTSLPGYGEQISPLSVAQVNAPPSFNVLSFELTMGLRTLSRSMYRQSSRTICPDGCLNVLLLTLLSQNRYRLSCLAILRFSNFQSTTKTIFVLFPKARWTFR
jgi:hypothetical protein